MAVTMNWTYPLAANAILTDVQQIQAMLNACIKLTPSGNNIPTGAVKLASVTGGKQLQSYNGSAYASIGKLMHDVDTLDGYHASTTAVASRIPVYNSSAKLVGSITGNAATATKLAATKKIDIGGIATATEQNFDGSANITIPITQITVNNNDDTAINGVLTTAHGGTGNTTGAASDITVSGNAGDNLSAKTYGQIGRAAGLSTKDLNSLTTDGFYIGSSSTSHTVAQHYPFTATANAALHVSTSGNFVMQHLKFGQGTWLRWSDDKGATWKPWQAEGGTVAANLIIYISKSGSNDNTGLTSDLPVLTVARAIQIANGRLQSTTNGTVYFRFGAGNWGDITFTNKPYYIAIQPYDGVNATEFSEDLPVFGTLTFQGSHAQVTSVVANVLTATGSGFIYVTNGLLRVGQIYARQGSHIFIVNHATNPIEVMNTSQGSVFCATHNGVITNYGSRKVKIVESIAPSNAFCHLAYTGKMTYVEGLTYEYASGATVTGKRAYIGKSSFLSTVSANTFPGTVANDFADGAIINGLPWPLGSGTALNVMLGDGTLGTVKNITSVTHLGWDSATEEGVKLANLNDLAYWNGRYNSTTSNLRYCNNGEIVGTSGNQTIGGTKTFSSTIAGSINGNAATATKLGTSTVGGANQPIYLNAGAATACNTMVTTANVNQTIAGTKTFSSTIAGSINGNAATADKVNANLVLKIKSGTTEGTNLYTFNGSAAKTLDIKQGSNITLTAAAGSLTIAATNTVYTHPSYTARTGVPTANAAPAFGGTFTVNQVNCDNTGHVTAVTSRTITIPSTAASASAAGLVTTGNQTFAGTKTFNSPIAGSVTGSSGSCTGNAATATTATTATKATKLATARNFRAHLDSNESVAFDGTAACALGVTGVLGVANGGTGNGKGRGPVASKSTRTTDGTWNITGLTVGLPVFIIFQQTSNHDDTACNIRVISGALADTPSNSWFGLGTDGTKEDWRTNCLVFIPTATTLSLNVKYLEDDGGKLHAFQ